MNIEDKLFKKIKENANQEIENFDAMDKVWRKIENKLENQTLKTEKKHWKSFAFIASFLLIISLVFLLLNQEKEVLKIPIINESETIVEENKQETTLENKINIQEKIKETTNSKDNLEKIIPQVVENQENVSTENANGFLESKTSTEQEVLYGKNVNREQYGYKTTTVYEDKSVKFHNPEAEKQEEEVQEVEKKKLNPLVVINGEIAKKGTKAINDIEVESLIELKEPLYIINGIHYSEQEMFGPNPTSPYAPLDQQDIIELKILLEEEAVKIYGEKGKKGVVIVTTKNNKPKR